MTTIGIRETEQYAFVCNGVSYNIDGSDIIKLVKGKTNTPELKDIYISLSRAIEEGNDLRVGIVIGQVLSRLTELINGN